MPAEAAEVPHPSSTTGTLVTGSHKSESLENILWPLQIVPGRKSSPPESQNLKKIWTGNDLKDQAVPLLAMKKYLPLDQVEKDERNIKMTKKYLCVIINNC